MMSSRMAAHLAMLDLFKLIDKTGEEIVFKAFSKMNWPGSRSGYYKKLQKFEKHGLIRKENKRDKPTFVITAKAKFLRSKAITKKSRSDGLSTLIIFDIPEAKRNARDTLRRYLTRSGYTQIRESCFLSPFQISQDMKDLIDELKLKNDISVFAAKMNLL